MTQLPPKDEYFLEIREDNQVFLCDQRFVALDDKPRPMAGDTQEGEKRETKRDFFFTRAPQRLPIEEPSFGNNFLSEHVKALHTIFQNLIESPSPAKTREKGDLQLPGNMIAIDFPLKNRASSSLVEFELQEMKMGFSELLEELKVQTDLNAFLGYVVDKLQKALAKSLVVLAVDIWAEVKNKDFRDYQLDDLRVMAGRWTKQKATYYFQRPDFQEFRNQNSSVCHESISHEKQSKFSEKVRHYIATILLILAGFFQNPYAETLTSPECSKYVDYPKRSFSEVSINFLSRQFIGSDSEDFEQPSKKVKTE